MTHYFNFENLLVLDGVTLTNVPSSGTMVDLTSINKIVSRQLADTYTFTFDDSSSTLTIENIPTINNGNYIGMVSIMNLPWGYMSISSVTLYKGAVPYTTTRESFVRDQTGNQNPAITQSYHYKSDTGNIDLVDKIVISVSFDQFEAPTDFNFYLGHIYAGEYVEVSVKPNVRYSNKNEVKPDVSNGGQFYYETPVPLKTIRAHITHNTQAETSTLYQHSLTHSTSLPVVFISDSVDYQTMYCTFANALTIQTLPAKDSADGWYHSGDANLIENK